MTVDPLLYLSFVGGLAAGRLVGWRSPWLVRILWADIFLLVFLLGLTVGPSVGLGDVATVLLSVGFALLILGCTLGFALLLGSRPKSSDIATPPARWPVNAVLVLVALVSGGTVGRFFVLPVGPALTYSLYVLLALVAFDLRWTAPSWRRVLVPFLASVAGGFLAAGLFFLVVRVPLGVALASGAAYGWYTLVGPVLATKYGATFGILGFLTNILRENFTMGLAPLIGRRVGGEGIAAMGGATSMDTTLYFVTRYGEQGAGSLALASGIALTALAGLIVPLFASLPGA